MNAFTPKVVAIAGASGLIGSSLAAALRAKDVRVLGLVRRPTASVDEIAWDPAAGRLEPAALEGVDAIVNLAGANIAGGRWTPARRRLILDSRVTTTRTLLTAMRQMARPPAVYVGASATGFYGSRGDDVLTEASGAGAGFLAEVCRVWEEQAPDIARLGVREVRMRFGIVLAAEGGALARMRPLFRLGLGGRLGDGGQWMSWVALDDAVAALSHALENARTAGPCNVTAPAPVRNAEFTEALARVLHRPAIVPAPAWALRLAFGAMADEALLGSTRALPARLEAEGFRFGFPRLEGALQAALSA